MNEVTLCVVLVVALAPALASAQVVDRFQWKRGEAESGCEVVTSAVAGKKYIASKATCTINARLGAIGEVLKDVPHYPTWMHDCTTTTMLRVVDEAKGIYVFWYRQHITILADRDVVLRSEVSHGNADGKEWRSIVAASTDEATYDSGKGYVRMPSFTSEWRLEELDPENTRVSFMIDPDLGEGLPLGLTNSLIAQVPLKSIRGLMRVLERQDQLLSSTKPLRTSGAPRRRP
jgi:hypothetical protein